MYVRDVWQGGHRDERKLLRAGVEQSTSVNRRKVPFFVDKNQCYKNNAVSSSYT